MGELHMESSFEIRPERHWKLGANRFSSKNPFCVEAKAAIQAFKMVIELNLDKITVEGDAQAVILAMHGVSEFGDWRAKHLIEEGKKYLVWNSFWFLQFTPRSCNAFVHNLAKWAFHSNFSGEVDPLTLVDIMGQVWY